MNKRNKFLKWVNEILNKNDPMKYENIDDINSEDDLYEDIEKFSMADVKISIPDAIEYNKYMREYFFLLRDVHTDLKGEDAVSVVTDPPFDHLIYHFPETELKIRLRSGTCLSNRPKICVCSCEATLRKAEPPLGSFKTWDATWVFFNDSHHMRELAKRSNNRLHSLLFDSKRF